MTDYTRLPRLRPPSRLGSLLVSASLVAVWSVLRLVVFPDFVLPLTFVVPMLVCVWTRDRIALRGMALAFAVLVTIEMFWVLPRGALPPRAFWATYITTLFNVAVATVVIGIVIRLRTDLEAALVQADAANEEIRAQAEELQAQAEELAQQNAELEQQTEELSEQTEELAQQNEALQAQTDEIHLLNQDLGSREQLLQHLLTAARVTSSEVATLERVCADGLALFRDAEAAVVYERQNGVLAVRAGASRHGNAEWPVTVSLDRRFAALAMEEKRTAALDDARLRPDLELLRVPGLPVFGAELAAPMLAEGAAFGALAVYASGTREWTDDEFRLAEWLAGQCARILETLRLQTDLRWRAGLIDLTPDAVLVRALDGTITFWSAGARALYGYADEEARDRRSHDLLQARFPEPLDRIEAALLEHGRWTGQVAHRTKDGREIVVESRWLLHRGGMASAAVVLESNIDITERQRADEAVRASDRRKSEFLATLSHELRNPLAAIRFALDALGRGDRTGVDAVAVMDRQLTHLVRLVDDLLDITRIGSNKFQLRRQRVDVAQILRHATEAASPAVERAGHALMASAPPIPIHLEVDPDRVAQVLTNLINNAARYTPPGGRIDVIVTAGNGDVVISVTDNGIGMRREDLGRVFDMFTQLAEPGRGGLGIGLALVKAVVELHGGHVEAHSDGPGQGSRFTVHLPIGDGRCQTVDAVPASDSGLAVAGATRRVLVVDDNSDAALMMKAVLDLQGHRVEVAHNGRAALQVLERFTPEIALLDIGLPDIDGYELARELRRDPRTRGTYLVAVTGWGQEEDRARSREHGFDAHLTKPADVADVMRIISDATRVDWTSEEV